MSAQANQVPFHDFPFARKCRSGVFANRPAPGASSAGFEVSTASFDVLSQESVRSTAWAL